MKAPVDVNDLNFYLHYRRTIQNQSGRLGDILHNQCQSKGRGRHGPLGQGQACLCFYSGHMDDLFKPPNPCDVSNTYGGPASVWADSQPSVCWCVLRVCACACAVCHDRLYKFMCFYTFRKLCWNVSQLWAKPWKHSKEQSLSANITDFYFFGFFCQFALQEEEKALIGLAGERTRPHRQQHLMLTVLAWTYVWVSDEFIAVCAYVSAYVCSLLWWLGRRMGCPKENPLGTGNALNAVAVQGQDTH